MAKSGQNLTNTTKEYLVSKKGERVKPFPCFLLLMTN
jgi:hypothetical protein